MATGKRKNQKESPEEELDRLLNELELTEEQREFIESMREDKGIPVRSNACLQPNEYEWPHNGIVRISSPHEDFPSASMAQRTVPEIVLK